MKSLAHELIEALAKLDAQIPTLGLYSSFEYRVPAGKTHPNWKIEWELALRPRLEALDYKFFEQPDFGKAKCRVVNPLFTSVRFHSPLNQLCDVRLIRTSMIKVRRYGSGYQTDRSVNFAERWNLLEMNCQIRQLWRPDRYQASADIRMVLFLGFAKARRPFHAELTQLEKTSCWPEHHVDFNSKSWPDIYGRDFGVLAACWTSATGSNL